MRRAQVKSRARVKVEVKAKPTAMLNLWSRMIVKVAAEVEMKTRSRVQGQRSMMTRNTTKNEPSREIGDAVSLGEDGPLGDDVGDID